MRLDAATVAFIVVPSRRGRLERPAAARVGSSRPTPALAGGVGRRSTAADTGAGRPPAGRAGLKHALGMFAEPHIWTSGTLQNSEETGAPPPLTLGSKKRRRLETKRQFLRLFILNIVQMALFCEARQDVPKSSPVATNSTNKYCRIRTVVGVEHSVDCGDLAAIASAIRGRIADAIAANEVTAIR